MRKAIGTVNRGPSQWESHQDWIGIRFIRNFELSDGQTFRAPKATLRDYHSQQLPTVAETFMRRSDRANVTSISGPLVWGFARWF
jgi:hypothetical protein